MGTLAGVGPYFSRMGEKKKSFGPIVTKILAEAVYGVPNPTELLILHVVRLEGVDLVMMMMTHFISASY